MCYGYPEVRKASDLLQCERGIHRKAGHSQKRRARRVVEQKKSIMAAFAVSAPVCAHVGGVVSARRAGASRARVPCRDGRHFSRRGVEKDLALEGFVRRIRCRRARPALRATGSSPVARRDMCRALPWNPTVASLSSLAARRGRRRAFRVPRPPALDTSPLSHIPEKRHPL